MHEVIIRQGEPADIEVIAPLFDCYRQFYGCSSDINAVRAFLSARLDHNESVIFIAISDYAAVGFAQLYPCFSSVSLADTFILNDLYVRQDSRRKGIGSSLLNAVVRHAKCVGAVRLTLTTAVNNKMAQALYEGSGWTRDEQFTSYHLQLK